jgi:hypothetical protein
MAETPDQVERWRRLVGRKWTEASASPVLVTSPSTARSTDLVSQPGPPLPSPIVERVNAPDLIVRSPIPLRTISARPLGSSICSTLSKGAGAISLAGLAALLAAFSTASAQLSLGVTLAIIGCISLTAVCGLLLHIIAEILRPRGIYE